MFQDVFDDMFPKSWLDPYGNMPLNNGLEASVDITVEKSDGVTKVSAVKTPPRSQHMSFSDALEMVLSITCGENGPLCSSLQPSDQGKRDSEDKPDKPEKQTKTDEEEGEDDGNRDRKPRFGKSQAGNPTRMQ